MVAPGRALLLCECLLGQSVRSSIHLAIVARSGLVKKEKKEKRLLEIVRRAKKQVTVFCGVGVFGPDEQVPQTSPSDPQHIHRDEQRYYFYP